MNKDWVDKAIRYWLTFSLCLVFHIAHSRFILQRYGEWAVAEVPRIYSDQSAPEESQSFYVLAEAYGTRQGDMMQSLKTVWGKKVWDVSGQHTFQSTSVWGGREDVTLTETIIRVWVGEVDINKTEMSVVQLLAVITHCCEKKNK